jgi:CheY-like chemotaxis protein
MESLHQSLQMCIALTADALKGVEEQLKKIGFDGYLTKPLKIKDLADELTNVTTKRNG